MLSAHRLELRAASAGRDLAAVDACVDRLEVRANLGGGELADEALNHVVRLLLRLSNLHGVFRSQTLDHSRDELGRLLTNQSLRLLVCHGRPLGRSETDLQSEWGLLSPEAIDEIAKLASRAAEPGDQYAGHDDRPRQRSEMVENRCRGCRSHGTPMPSYHQPPTSAPPS
jgi:hypothetical protein